MDYRNNFVLRKLRYAMNLKDADIKKIFALDDFETDEKTVKQYLEKEDSPMFRELTDKVLERFLNGLITFKRGKKEDTNYRDKKKVPKRVLMPDSSSKKGFS